VQAIQQIQWYAKQGVITLIKRSKDIDKLKPIDNVDLGDTIDGVRMLSVKAFGARNNTIFDPSSTSSYPLLDVHPRNAVAIIRLVRRLKAKWPDLAAILTQGVNSAPAGGTPKVISDTDTTSDGTGFHEEGRSIDFSGVVLRSTQQPGNFDALWILHDWGEKFVPNETAGAATVQPAATSPNQLDPQWPAVVNTDAEAIQHPLKYRLDYLVSEPPAVPFSLLKQVTTKVTRELFRDVYAIARSQYSPSQGEIGTYGRIIHPDYPLLGGAFNGRVAHKNHIHMNVVHYRQADVAAMWNALRP
jgi:hypothetical protein